MKRNKQHTHQLNCKMTASEFERVQSVNDKLFSGELNNSDLARFLFNYAIEKLVGAKVEKKMVITVDGLEVK